MEKEKKIIKSNPDNEQPHTQPSQRVMKESTDADLLHFIRTTRARHINFKKLLSEHFKPNT